jgi:hypothetical protein
MDYFKVFKKAYEISVKNKYLWIFGIFLAGIQGGNVVYSFNGSESDKITNFSLTTVVLIILAVIFFTWWLMALVAEGGLLKAVEGLDENKKQNFKEVFKAGIKNFTKTLSVFLLIILIVIISLLILAVPVILLVIGQMYILAIIYGIFVFIIDFFLWIYLSIVYSYIIRIAVLGNHSARKAFALSWPFVKKHWLDILVIAVFWWALSILIMLGLFVAILLVGALLVGIGLAVYLASSYAGQVYTLFFSFMAIVVITVFFGVLRVFQSSILTLAYREMVKGKNS